MNIGITKNGSPLLKPVNRILNGEVSVVPTPYSFAMLNVWVLYTFIISIGKIYVLRVKDRQTICREELYMLGVFM